MSYAGKILTNYVAGMPWVWVYVILVVGYVLIHYPVCQSDRADDGAVQRILAVGIASGESDAVGHDAAACDQF